MTITPPPVPTTTKPAGCPCAQIGPTLIGVGSSGRRWVCGGCGRTWVPDDAVLGAALIGAVLGGPASVGMSLTCDEAEDVAAGLALLSRRGDALALLREHARQDADAGDEADRHANADDGDLAAAIDLAIQTARTTGARR